MYSSTNSLTSALDRGVWSASRPGHFTPRERNPGTHWIGGWVGARAGLDALSKRKFPAPAGNPTLNIQSSSLYTDWPTPALIRDSEHENVCVSDYAFFALTKVLKIFRYFTHCTEMCYKEDKQHSEFHFKRVSFITPVWPSIIRFIKSYYLAVYIQLCFVSYEFPDSI
jgi:hypothetical protein